MSDIETVFEEDRSGIVERFLNLTKLHKLDEWRIFDNVPCGRYEIYAHRTNEVAIYRCSYKYLNMPNCLSKERLEKLLEKKKELSDLLRQTFLSDLIPRRCQVQKMTREELAVRDAILKVEELPADPRLTDAVVLLGQAQEKIADYVDGKEKLDGSN